MFPPLSNNYRDIEERKQLFSAPFSKTATVLIPFYQDLNILSLSLASLVRQEYPAHLWDVMVSGDGTSEDVNSLVEEYISVLNIKFINQERRGYRLNATRNHGIL